jgi:uncharacterized protein (TIGR02466 family)
MPGRLPGIASLWQVRAVSASASSMFANRTAATLFPTFVWAHDLKPEDQEAVERSAVALVHRLLTPRPPLKERLTWQTPTNLHTAPEFARLNELVLGASVEILRFLSLQELPLEITGAWANINPTGAPHPVHSHPNNFLSFVYYPVSQPPGSTIDFHDPRPQAHVIAPPFVKMTPANGSKVTIAAQGGRLLAFPSWLDHSVPENRAPVERMSIALNVMFRESIARPRWSGSAGADKL